ncbi:hypothetical protein CHS0354_041125 [Potamilus streckersoni]|uniref:G-protein coupled receptors family 2 profile 2 domain-containing protein n=1 Tax=Potamilus streckersoni TaxID=2493646 RepID=A0AAE0SDY5_9BIVA|nr:hypothetical protein CHS0354_041125 [Potamilus streckersoni]
MHLLILRLYHVFIYSAILVGDKLETTAYYRNDTEFEESEHIEEATVSYSYNMDNISPKTLLTFEDITSFLTKQETLNFLDFFKDPNVRQNVKIYLYYCPFNDICNFTLGLGNSFAARDSCCEMCRCDDACRLDGKCCPDMMASLEDIVVVETKVKCQYATLFRPPLDSMSADTGYYFIADCPSGSDEEIRTRCTRIPDYDDTILDNLDFSNMTPVTSMRDRLTYRNTFCASCHMIKGEDLVYWDVSLRCKSFFTQFTVTMIAEHIRSKNCKIDFQPPLNLEYQQEICRPTISSCNETGKWLHYNEAIEKLCHSTYGSNFNNQFKNVFCMLCNNATNIKDPYCPASSIPTDVSFTALLNFKREEVKNPEETTQCRGGMMFDPYMQQCRKLYCSSTRVLIDGKCVSFWTTAEKTTWKILLGFLPLERCPFLSSDQILKTIDNWFSDLLAEWMPFAYSVCNRAIAFKVNYTFNTFLYSDDTIHGNYTAYAELADSNIMMFYSRWQFELRGPYRLDLVYEMVQYLTKMNITFLLDNTIEMILLPRIVNMDEACFNHPSDCMDLFFNDNQYNNNSMNIVDSGSDEMLTTYKRATDNKTIVIFPNPIEQRIDCVPLSESLTLSDIIPCTMIELDSQQIDWYLTEYGVYVPKLDMHFNMTNFVMVVNASLSSGSIDNNHNETLTFPSDNFIIHEEIENMLSRDDVISFLERISDSFAREATRFHIKYCPFTNVCNFSLDLRSDPLIRQPCVPCVCNSSCEITGNCCPDYQSDKYSGSIKRDKSQDNCQYAAFVEESHPFLLGEGYYFISKCMYSTNETEIESCLQPKRPTTLEDFSDIIPVTDKTTRINYKNRYCAECNKISASNLIYWSIVLHCLVDMSSEANNMRRIMQFIDQQQCNFLYKPKDDDGHRTSVCTPMVTKCNPNGKWQENSEIIAKACTMNIGSVYQSIDQLYANVYCMLCNDYGDHNSRYTQRRPPQFGVGISFSALLNFNHDVKEPDKSTSCGEDQIMDPYEKECRNLYCSSTRRLINKECVHLFREVTDAKYELVLGFCIDEPYYVYKVNALIDKISAWFFEVLQQSIPSARVCSKETIYKTDFNYSDFIKEFQSEAEYYVNLSTIKYIASKWIFQVGGYYSYESMYAFVQNITNAAVTLTINKNTKYMVHPKLVYIEEDAFALIPISNGLFHAIDDRNSLPFLYAYPCKGDNKTVIRHITPNDDWYCPAIGGLIRLPFDILPCTLMEIRKEEYEFLIMDHGVVLPTLNLYLNMTEFVTTNDSKNNIRICSKNYIASFNEKSSADKRQISAETILSVVCTGVSLICLVVTFIIYLRFPILQTVPGKNNMVLIVNLTFAQMLYLIFIAADTFSGWACKLVGILLHFFWLSAVLWLNICTFHMFKVFVRLNKPNLNVSSSKTVFKYTLTVFTVSCLLVLVNVIKGLADSGMTQIGYGLGICYISSGIMVGYTFALPVGFVILSNLFMFLVVVHKVRSLPNVDKNVKNQRNNVVIFAKLSSITGITWIFGLLYQWTNEIALSYVFIVLNASLGVFIMISFVINRRVFRLARGESASSISRSKHTTHNTENSAC